MQVGVHDRTASAKMLEALDNPCRLARPIRYSLPDQRCCGSGILTRDSSAFFRSEYKTRAGSLQVGKMMATALTSRSILPVRSPRLVRLLSSYAISQCLSMKIRAYMG